MAGAIVATGGGSGVWRDAVPSLYDRPLGSVPVLLPILFILALVAVPPLLLGRKRRRVT